jgi:protein subunit release factor A
MKKKLAMKKKATPEKLKIRAMKKARDVVRAKFIKGKSYKDLSYSEKIQLDKKVEKKQAMIKKIAKKLLPAMKKAEAERIKSLRKQAGGEES